MAIPDMHHLYGAVCILEQTLYFGLQITGTPFTNMV